MTLSIWRYAHLLLATLAAVFIFIASITGIILAADEVKQQFKPLNYDSYESLTLAKVIPTLKKHFLEISELEIDTHGFVLIKALDLEGNEVEAYVNPNTGNIIGKPEKKSEWIQWVTSLHRSLFLHETGRIIMGISAFLLLLIAITGALLISQRQNGFRRFLTRIPREKGWTFWHVILGRFFLIPIIIIALTGAWMMMYRLNSWGEVKEQQSEINLGSEAIKVIDIDQFKSFQIIHLKDVQKIVFPFTEDVEEYYQLKLKDRSLLINQFNGQVLSEVEYPKTLLLQTVTLDLHTGRTHIIWAMVLGITALSILYFIGSGFTMSWKRMRNKIHNLFSKEESTIVLWVGSENGSTLGFANLVKKQWEKAGEKVFIAEMNRFESFPNATHFIFFTSTHGTGEAPSNANIFLNLLSKTVIDRKIKTVVVGFGSKNYPDFCAFAKEVQVNLQKQTWNDTILPLHTINDKSTLELVTWIKAWNQKSTFQLSETPAYYSQTNKELMRFKVIAKSENTAEGKTFIIQFKPQKRAIFKSGDLLVIYPGNQGEERIYSIGKIDNKVQLIVKLHENGLGSGFLNKLTLGAEIEAKIMENPTFHLPSRRPVILISNGTGIAPFIGMISQNKGQELHLFAGFRQKTSLVTNFVEQMNDYLATKKISSFHLALSREGNREYVTQLLEKQTKLIVETLNHNGVIMICGSLTMMKDVKIILSQICHDKLGQDVDFYTTNGQILTDCY